MVARLLNTPQTGLHIDYLQNSDGTMQGGQLAHFWSYFNTKIQGGEAIFRLADIYHECAEGGGTVPDARLSTRAYQLGDYWDEWGIGYESIRTFNETLRSPFNGCLLEHYYSICGSAELINYYIRRVGGEEGLPIPYASIAERHHGDDTVGWTRCVLFGDNDGEGSYTVLNFVSDLSQNLESIRQFVESRRQS